MTAQGKINLRGQISFPFHRSGWRYAIKALAPLHNDNGVTFDGVVDQRFLWTRPTTQPTGETPEATCEPGNTNASTAAAMRTRERRNVPIREPWVGFVHHPPNMPVWFQYQHSPQMLVANKHWQESLEPCVGLFALSRYHAEWMAEHTGKPVSAVIHPTEIPDCQFSFSAFMDNDHKKIVQIGWWLRKLNAIKRLPVPRGNPLGYEKIRLMPCDCPEATTIISNLTHAERRLYRLSIESGHAENTRDMAYVSNADYDLLLSRNLVFVDLYDSSANNAVVECIARATPILVNRIPAVVEYLGEAYPMYFEDLADAAEKAQDIGRINEAHMYLKTCDTRNRLSADYFLESVINSEVYGRI